MTAGQSPGLPAGRPAPQGGKPADMPARRSATAHRWLRARKTILVIVLAVQQAAWPARRTGHTPPQTPLREREPGAFSGNADRRP